MLLCRQLITFLSWQFQCFSYQFQFTKSSMSLYSYLSLQYISQSATGFSIYTGTSIGTSTGTSTVIYLGTSRGTSINRYFQIGFQMQIGRSMYIGLSKQTGFSMIVGTGTYTYFIIGFLSFSMFLFFQFNSSFSSSLILLCMLSTSRSCDLFYTYVGISIIFSGPATYLGTSTRTSTGFSTTIYFIIWLGTLFFRPNISSFLCFSNSFKKSISLLNLQLSPSIFIMSFYWFRLNPSTSFKLFNSNCNRILSFQLSARSSLSWWIFLNNFLRHSLLSFISFSMWISIYFWPLGVDVWVLSYRDLNLVSNFDLGEIGMSMGTNGYTFLTGFLFSIFTSFIALNYFLFSSFFYFLQIMIGVCILGEFEQ